MMTKLNLNGDKIKTVIATTTEKFYLNWDNGEFSEFGGQVVEFSIE